MFFKREIVKKWKKEAKFAKRENKNKERSLIDYLTNTN
jgi:hypothetical protein